MIILQNLNKDFINHIMQVVYDDSRGMMKILNYLKKYHPEMYSPYLIMFKKKIDGKI